MRFEKVFKGFYKSNGKQPILKKKDIDTLALPWEQVQSFDSYVGYLAKGYVLVDIDNKTENGQYDENKTESKKLIDILGEYGIKTPIVETTHGHHFYFKTSGDNIKSLSGVLAPIGLCVDYKLGDKNGCACFKLNGEERKIIQDTEEVAELPIFLLHNQKLRNKLEELRAGEGASGRNDFLSSYKFQLLKLGYSIKDTYRICETINNHMMYEPLEAKEFTTLMRQENIEPDAEEDPFYIVTENGKKKLSTEKVARYIVKENNLIRIEKLLFGLMGNTTKESKGKILKIIS